MDGWRKGWRYGCLLLLMLVLLPLVGRRVYGLVDGWMDGSSTVGYGMECLEGGKAGLDSVCSVVYDGDWGGGE